MIWHAGVHVRAYANGGHEENFAVSEKMPILLSLSVVSTSSADR